MSQYNLDTLLSIGDIQTPTMLEEITEGTLPIKDYNTISKVDKRGFFSWVPVIGETLDSTLEVGEALLENPEEALKACATGALASGGNPYACGASAAMYGMSKAEQDKILKEQQDKYNAGVADGSIDPDKINPDGSEVARPSIYDDVVAEVFKEEGVRYGFDTSAIQGILDESRDIATEAQTQLTKTLDRVTDTATSLDEVTFNAVNEWTTSQGDTREAQEQLGDTAKNLISKTHQQHSEWTAKYGTVNQNLTDYMNNLNPADFSAGQKAILNREYAKASSSVTRLMSQRGIIDSGMYDEATIKNTFALAQQRAGADTEAVKYVTSLQQQYVNQGEQDRVDWKSTVDSAGKVVQGADSLVDNASAMVQTSGNLSGNLSQMALDMFGKRISDLTELEMSQLKLKIDAQRVDDNKDIGDKDIMTKLLNMENTKDYNDTRLDMTREEFDNKMQTAKDNNDMNTVIQLGKLGAKLWADWNTDTDTTNTTPAVPDSNAVDFNDGDVNPSIFNTTPSEPSSTPAIVPDTDNFNSNDWVETPLTDSIFDTDWEL